MWQSADTITRGSSGRTSVAMPRYSHAFRTRVRGTHMQGRTAVVTGAGQGLGRADARRLSRDGFHVVCLDRDGEAARATAEEVGGTAHRCDVTDRDAVFAVA